jgi:hypothetical protein
VILVDADVFVIDLRYHRDPLRRINRRFLDRLAMDGSGATTVFNLLEVAGILSFNFNEEQLLNLLFLFPGKYGIAILPPLDLESILPQIPQGALARRIAFGDALVIEAAERYAPKASCFVTWDSEYFAGRTALTVMTPKSALDAWPRGTTSV